MRSIATCPITFKKQIQISITLKQEELQTIAKMPLPDFGYANRETRKKQELVFPMAPGKSMQLDHMVLN